MTYFEYHKEKIDIIFILMEQQWFNANKSKILLH